MRRGASTRAVLLDRLDARRDEIEQAVLNRIRAVADQSRVEDPEYVTGLRHAVRAALGHAIAVLQSKEPRQEAVPAELVSQARAAARNGVGLETVLRRYFAGHAILAEFIMAEASACRLDDSTLRFLLSAQATLLDRLVTAVSSEYGQEVDRQRRPSNLRRVARVEALLAGETVDPTEMAYDFAGWHLGVIAIGHDSARVVAELAGVCGRGLLAIERDEMTTWAWLGGLRRFDPDELLAIAPHPLRSDVALVLGEAAPQLNGWRLTHQQARAAVPVAQHRGEAVTRYSDVSLLASALRDEVLSRSLENLYLAPLAAGRDGGATLRKTLRAYFRHDRNSTSAAAALGVTRQTVNNRLRIIEQQLDCEIGVRGVELDLALRLAEMSEALSP